MRALSVLAVLGGIALAGISHQCRAADLPVDLELLLAVDVSGSVDPGEAKLQRAGYVGALTDKRVVSAIKSGIFGRIAVAYVEWADSHLQSTVLGWTLIDGTESAHGFADRLDEAPIMRGRFTSISALIERALPMFADNGFEGTRRVIDISGDGANNTGNMVTVARDVAVRAGIIINGLPIVNDRQQRFGPQIANLDLYYRNCVIGGRGAFLIVAQDFESFAVAIRKKLILEIAGRQPPVRLLHRVAQRRPFPAVRAKSPECDIGERQLDRRLRNMYHLDN